MYVTITPAPFALTLTLTPDARTRTLSTSPSRRRMCHQIGVGGPVDVSGARALWEKAATAADDPVAHNNLAVLLPTRLTHTAPNPSPTVSAVASGLTLSQRSPCLHLAFRECMVQ
jgi:hypothetical protein